mmetsp:Transcript_98974/g.285622  ORF Transcript_98974/g.285622 Transcript_98974/m.285622 type:complete len:204 (-) Transcript_98974:384-995(-)
MNFASKIASTFVSEVACNILASDLCASSSDCGLSTSFESSSPLASTIDAPGLALRPSITATISILTMFGSIRPMPKAMPSLSAATIALLPVSRKSPPEACTSTTRKPRLPLTLNLGLTVELKNATSIAVVETVAVDDTVAIVEVIDAMFAAVGVELIVVADIEFVVVVVDDVGVVVVDSVAFVDVMALDVVNVTDAVVDVVIE